MLNLSRSRCSLPFNDAATTGSRSLGWLRRSARTMTIWPTILALNIRTQTCSIYRGVCPLLLCLRDAPLSVKFWVVLLDGACARLCVVKTPSETLPSQIKDILRSWWAESVRSSRSQNRTGRDHSPSRQVEPFKIVVCRVEQLLHIKF